MRSTRFFQFLSLILIVTSAILGFLFYQQINKPKPVPIYYGDIKGYGIAKPVKGDFVKLDETLSPKTLASGKYTLMIRHTLRDSLGGKVLWEADRNEKCIKGSSLNATGIDQAKSIKNKIEELGIPIGEVIASPTCRTIELAKIGFGRVDRKAKDIWYQPMMKIGEKTMFDLALYKMLTDPVPRSGNRIIVGHNNTVERLGLEGVPTRKLEQGDAAVFKPNGKGDLVYVGTIAIGAWQK